MQETYFLSLSYWRTQFGELGMSEKNAFVLADIQSYFTLKFNRGARGNLV